MSCGILSLDVASKPLYSYIVAARVRSDGLIIFIKQVRRRLVRARLRLNNNSVSPGQCKQIISHNVKLSRLEVLFLFLFLALLLIHERRPSVGVGEC